jgi:beta-lactam-binding protein with PASTA domain
MSIFRRATNEPPTAAPPPAYDPAATQPLPAPASYDTVVEEYGPPPPPRIWPWLLALLVLLALGVGIGLGYALTRDDSKASTTTTPATGIVTVPDVVGQRADRAASRLVDAGLKTTFERQLSKQQTGTVLAQQPGAASSAPAGSTVTLTIARGADTAGVPAVVGLPLAQALARLRVAGLQASEQRVADAKPAGQVIAQTPGGGRELNRGATIALTVSRGAQPVAVPNVVGQTQADATSALEAAGLKAGVRTVPSSGPQGTVAAQSPQAGQRRPKGATVQINVSGGRADVTTTTGDTPGSPVPAKVQIPDVVGMTLADVRASLAKAGLKTDPMEVASTQPKSTVVAQYPAAGAPAKHGGSVRVNVSQGPGTKAVPDVTGDDEATATTKLENAGFTVKIVRRDTTDASEDGTVLDETPAGGTDAKLGAKVTLTIGSLTSG